MTQPAGGGKFTVGSLFTGIGGFDLGLERAGMQVRWQVEINPFCRAVLEKHWPHVQRYTDVRTVGAELERVDVVCGGFPCQPFSSASRGRRRGTGDDRYLWPEMRRIVSEVRPAWVVGENVTHIDRSELETVVSDLEALGYEVAPPLEVPACAFGHDHWRPRIWIIGYADSHCQSRRSVNAKASGVPRNRDDAASMGAADGVSGGLDRRRMEALGNAIVPDIAQWIGLEIIRAQRQMRAA